MAGYSGTPLPRKLGIRPGSRVHLVDAPPGYRALLEPLPEGASFATRLTKTTDLIHVFSGSRAGLEKALRRIRDGMRPDAAVWVSWPKKASRVPTDVTEDVVRDVALPLGLVDIKVCAIDDVWSGLKVVMRKHLR